MEIRAILQRTESELLELLAGAAKGGDYNGIDVARETAAAIRSLHTRLGSANSPSRDGEESRSSRPRRRRPGRRTGASKGYPRFVVEDDSLIKVGWSRKKREEYTQRIPSPVFIRVLEGLEVLSSAGNGPVGSEAMLQWLEEHGEAVPTYQTYGVLRFLRDRKIVRQVGRGEYAVPADVSERGRAAWRATAGGPNGRA